MVSESPGVEGGSKDRISPSNSDSVRLGADFIDLKVEEARVSPEKWGNIANTYRARRGICDLIYLTTYDRISTLLF